MNCTRGVFFRNVRLNIWITQPFVELICARRIRCWKIQFPASVQKERPISIPFHGPRSLFSPSGAETGTSPKKSFWGGVQNQCQLVLKLIPSLYFPARGAQEQLRAKKSNYGTVYKNKNKLYHFFFVSVHFAARGGQQQL